MLLLLSYNLIYLEFGVNAIAFKFSEKYDPIILRKKDHTPLRVDPAKFHLIPDCSR